MDNLIMLLRDVVSFRWEKCNSNSLEIALESKYDRSAPSLAYLSYVGMYRKLHIDGNLDNNVASEMAYAGKSIVPWIATIKDLITLTNIN